MTAAKRQEPAAVHAARSHGDRLSVELVEAWDDLQRRLELAEGCILVPPCPVMDALESWLEAEKPNGVEVTSEDVDRNVRWSVVRQWFEAAGGTK